MKLTFLGTGTSQGVPVIACECKVCQSIDYRDKRLRTSVLISVEDKNIVIDTGPDFRQQMLRERVSHLEAVLFTHEHKDHTAGMDDVRSFNFKQKIDMPVYAEPRVIDQLKREFAYIFVQEKYPGVPRIAINEINEQPFNIDGIEIIPIRGLHYKLPVLGFRIGDITYLTDVNHLEPSEKAKIKGSKIFVVNALQKEPHISHYTLEEALELVKEISPEKAYFTHLSHKMGLQKEVEKELPENVYLAYDGLQVTI